MTELHSNLITGKSLYYSFIAGSQQLLNNQEELNRINVFPVPDRDTGTNLASTIRSIIDTIKPDRSYKKTIEQIAEAALLGARGNSGVIFAQFLHGLSRETEDKAAITFADFAITVKQAIPYIYRAIANPIEGTMLTVISDWSQFLNSKREVIQGKRPSIENSLAVLEQSLSETTHKLKPLTSHGLVDAGAKGFVLFIKGVIDFIQNRDIRTLQLEPALDTTHFHGVDQFEIDPKYRFCTEAMLTNLNQKSDKIESLLKQFGDSIVVAGSEKLSRIHLHTDQPAELFEKLAKYGTVTSQKVDDMVRQQQIVTSRKWNIALVTDSTCDLPQELIEEYQINVVPMNLNFGESQFLDKVTMLPEQFYTRLEQSSIAPKTSQINERTFTNLYSQLATHYDAVISIHVSSQFSGTYDNSVKAAARIQNEFQKPIYTFDSKTLSGALGLIVLKTAHAIEAGEDIETIVKSTESNITESEIFVSVKELNSMIRSGRVSKQAGYFASLLGITPIVSMDQEGKALLFGKTFGQRSGWRKILNHISEIGSDKTIWNYTVLHASNPDDAAIFAQKAEQQIGKKPISIIDISPVIGMHAGRGCIAISLIFNPKN